MNAAPASNEAAAVPGSEFARYFAASLAALLLDVAVLQIAVGFMHYLAATSLGFIAGAIAHYLLSTRWVFRTRRLAERPPVEFSAFVAIGLGGLAINDLVMFLAVGRCGLAVLTAKLAAAGCTFLFNYTARKLALF